MTNKRHKQRVAVEGERPAEETYSKTEREIARARRLENRDAWAEHHGRMASYLSRSPLPPCRAEALRRDGDPRMNASIRHRLEEERRFARDQGG